MRFLSWKVPVSKRKHKKAKKVLSPHLLAQTIRPPQIIIVISNIVWYSFYAGSGGRAALSAVLTVAFLPLFLLIFDTFLRISNQSVDHFFRLIQFPTANHFF